MKFIPVFVPKEQIVIILFKFCLRDLNPVPTDDESDADYPTIMAFDLFSLCLTIFFSE